ncbi:uncharacterized protein METZ01_LOCUS507747, partial [marine metagenome]
VTPIKEMGLNLAIPHIDLENLVGNTT